VYQGPGPRIADGSRWQQSRGQWITWEEESFWRQSFACMALPLSPDEATLRLYGQKIRNLPLQTARARVYEASTLCSQSSSTFYTPTSASRKQQRCLSVAVASGPLACLHPKIFSHSGDDAPLPLALPPPPPERPPPPWQPQSQQQHNLRRRSPHSSQMPPCCGHTCLLTTPTMRMNNDPKYLLA
jgi:hypothetical protein